MCTSFVAVALAPFRQVFVDNAVSFMVLKKKKKSQLMRKL